jgi:hypothetical protein
MAWRALVASGAVRFAFHDLQHKARTDYRGDKEKFRGHAILPMVRRYDHSAEKVSAIGDGEEGKGGFRGA